MTERNGTTVETSIDRVVDGDTVAVTIGGREEKLRLSHLDTEESNHGSDKPVTPWGKKAKERAIELLPPGAAVTLEFAGTEPLEVCLERYRDNFGRLLVWLYHDDQDFQERMIGEGYSPYFNKYGYADFESHHERYLAAERTAQTGHTGVWDQVGVNGSEQRNYALLGVWWTLRAELITAYRGFRAAQPALLNSRLDYAELVDLARQREEATVFTELRTYTPVGQNKAIVDIGSRPALQAVPPQRRGRRGPAPPPPPRRPLHPQGRPPRPPQLRLRPRPPPAVPRRARGRGHLRPPDHRRPPR